MFKMDTMLTFLFFWNLILFLTSILIKGVDSSRGEDRLLHDIFIKNSYNSLSRPVINHKQTLNVKMEIVISQVVAVDEMNENVVLSMWKHMRWSDYRLVWNTSDYDGVESIRLPKNKIWTPDIVLYNRLEEETSREQDSLIIVSHTGQCLYMPFGVYSAQCTIDIRWFPFDDQLCPLDYESWTYDVEQVNLTAQKGSADLGWYKNSTEWKLVDAVCERVEKKYECCESNFSVLRFTLHLRRKTLYYVFNLILPCALISVLTILAFLLPTESGERVSLSQKIWLWCQASPISINRFSMQKNSSSPPDVKQVEATTMPQRRYPQIYGITGLLALSVYQIIVLENIPASSDSVPLIGLYFSSLIFLNITGITMTIVSVNLHHKNSKLYPMPAWVRNTVCIRLAALLRVSRPTPLDQPNCTPKILSKKEQDNVASSADCMACPLMTNRSTWKEFSRHGLTGRAAVICCCSRACNNRSKFHNNIDQSEAVLQVIMPCTSNDSICINTTPTLDIKSAMLSENYLPETIESLPVNRITNEKIKVNGDGNFIELKSSDQTDQTLLNEKNNCDLDSSSKDSKLKIANEIVNHKNNSREESVLKQGSKQHNIGEKTVENTEKPSAFKSPDLPSQNQLRNRTLKLTSSGLRKNSAPVVTSWREQTIDKSSENINEPANQLDFWMKSIERLIKNKHDRMQEKEGLDDWKFAGMVLDRACFWLIAIFQMGTSLTIFTLAVISEMKS